MTANFIPLLHYLYLKSVPYETFIVHCGEWCHSALPQV